MGCYTFFQLEGVEPSEMRQCITEELELCVGYNPFEDDSKWYNMEQDCIGVSLKYSTTAFKVSGYGENSGDIWWKEFLGGKIVAEWKLEAIDLSGLTPETRARAQELNA